MSVTFNKTITYGTPQIISFSSTDNLDAIQAENYMQEACSNYPFIQSDIVLIQYTNDDTSVNTGMFSATIDMEGNVTVTQQVKF